MIIFIYILIIHYSELILNLNDDEIERKKIQFIYFSEIYSGLKT